MDRRNLVLSLTFLLTAPVQGQVAARMARTHLLPIPSSLIPETGSFGINESFSVALPPTASPRLRDAVQRTLVRFEESTGITFKGESAKTPPALEIEVTGKSPEVLALNEEESYELVVTPERIRLKAPTDLGALHGLETLVQLIEHQPSGFDLPAVTIADRPRFRWRGLLIDCGRHFEPLEVLKRNIDAMAAVKLNVFHWHLTEDQGFRIESKQFPKLTALGSDGKFYTQEEARELVAYAYARGVRVVPEFEMPGHSSAWLIAYPELNSGSQPQGIRREFGVSPYVLDPTREETYQFIEAFLAEMATIFPDQYVHIGGDEAPAPDWKSNPRIIEFMKAHQLADNRSLQAYFNQRVLAILMRLHKRMVGWDEILHPALPKDVVIQSWRGVKSLAQGAAQGYQGILSAPYYLDRTEPASTHYLADPIATDSALSAQQQEFVLGGEVCMWGEFVDRRNIDSRIWPRSAAIAERLWSPQSVRDVPDMYRRLDYISVEMEGLGLTNLQSEGAGLRGLASLPVAADLRIFASAFEPAPLRERALAKQNNTLSPLTAFADSIVPDPPIRHRLIDAANTITAEAGTGETQKAAMRGVLQDFFSSEANSLPAVRAEIETTPRLHALQQRADQLERLAGIGTQALAYLRDARTPAGWKGAALEQIKAARTPGAFVRFDFLDALTTLVTHTQD